MRKGMHLFSEAKLVDILEQRVREMIFEINNYTANYLLNISVEDFYDYLEDRYKYKIPILKIDEIYVDGGEINVDVGSDRQTSKYVKGTFATFVIPFEGDYDLFRYKPAKYTSKHPRADIFPENNELHIRFEGVELEPKSLRLEFDHQLKLIQQYLEWTSENVTQFNAELRLKAQELTNTRREKFLKDRGLTASLGFPMKHRENELPTYTTPVFRKKSPIRRAPTATIFPYTPEPELEMKEYEYILGIIQEMNLAIERSPKAFSKMDEESLRHIFLVALNGHYEGSATGETFNFEGKTDILIRTEGRNIFIAECKFWKGAESLRKTIDQLLGYTSWRDTKAAVILFNRNKDFSAVLIQISDAISSHQNFKRQLDYSSETAFRFVFSQNNDKNREVIVTVLVFDVPS